jgi:hypothetical protein
VIDLDTHKVILSKPVRHKAFVLGKSVALECTTAAVMDDGTLRVITERKADYWENRPLMISFVPGQWKGREGFPELVKWLRYMEADYITAELPETCCP